MGTKMSSNKCNSILIIWSYLDVFLGFPGFLGVALKLYQVILLTVLLFHTWKMTNKMIDLAIQHLTEVGKLKINNTHEQIIFKIISKNLSEVFSFDNQKHYRHIHSSKNISQNKNNFEITDLWWLQLRNRLSWASPSWVCWPFQPRVRPSPFPPKSFARFDDVQVPPNEKRNDRMDIFIHCKDC